MASVSYTVQAKVDRRLSKYIRDQNKLITKKNQLKSRTDGIDSLLKRAGY